MTPSIFHLYSCRKQGAECRMQVCSLCFGENCWENPYSERGIHVQNPSSTAILERFSWAAWQHFGELSTPIKQRFLLKGRQGSCRKTCQPWIHPWLHKCCSQEGPDYLPGHLEGPFGARQGLMGTLSILSLHQPPWQRSEGVQGNSVMAVRGWKPWHTPEHPHSAV